MRVSAKVDYAVRAAVELARREHDGPVKGDVIGEAQGIPFKFLENILAELRAEGIVMSRRGSDGGYWLARPAAEITVAQVVRAVEGPIAGGARPATDGGRLSTVVGRAARRVGRAPGEPPDGARSGHAGRRGERTAAPVRG